MVEGDPHHLQCTHLGGSRVALTKGDLPGRIKRPHGKRLRQRWSLLSHTRARVAELADALRSGRSDRKVVEVRVLSRAPISPHEGNVSHRQTKIILNRVLPL